MSEMLPDGAWLLAGMDFDTSGSAKQKELEDKLRKDPSAVRNKDGGCQFPTSHMAFAVYANTDIGVVSRGTFSADAMLDCIASSAKDASRTQIDNHDVVKLDGGLVVLASDTGLLMFAHEPVLKRALADQLRPADTDPALLPLITKARGIGEIWAAGRIPKHAPIVDDVLGMLSVKLTGRIQSFTAGIHFTEPFKIEIDFDLEEPGDAQLLATALAQKLQWLTVLDAKLETVVDSLAVRADGTHVQVLGTPGKVDWLEAFSGLMGAIAAIKNQLEN
ncbi:MAG: hypothetical protein HOV81_41595 [Kofleriaceae bacterium]|nr:hypothetical protein [Kofleriaceae bacterium]